MATVGRKLLSAIIDSGDKSQWTKLNLSPVLFRDTEVLFYDFILGHLKKHKKLPGKATCIEVLGEVLVSTEEPPEYYLDLTRDRYLHNTIKKLLLDCGEFLKEEEPHKAMDMLMAASSSLHVGLNQQEMVDIKKIGNMIYNEYVDMHSVNHEHDFKFGWETLDNMTGGLRGGDLCTIIGRPSCLSGDTNLYVARKGTDGSGRWYTLRQLYRGMAGLSIKSLGKGSNRRWDLSIPTYTQCLMGETTGLNLVEQVIYSGVKETWTLITVSGKEIKATLDHMFLTEGGAWKELRDIRQGDNLVVKAPPKGKALKYINPTRKEIMGHFVGTPYRSKVVNGCTYQRVAEHRAVFEAALNGVSLQEFLLNLRTNPNHGYKFVSPGMHIHHKDHDRVNNEPDNLECLSSSEHGKRHAAEEPMARRFGQNEVMLDPVKSIIRYGEEDTFDIVMADPHNNFLAEGFVTHNSGKTFMGLYTALTAWNSSLTPLFVSMEMTKIAISQRIASMITRHNLTNLMKGTVSTKKMKEMMLILQKFKEKEQSFWLLDGNLTATVDDIVLKTQQLQPSCVWIDGAYLLRNPDQRLSRFERITHNAEALKQRLATELGVPVLASYQFNRNVGKPGKKKGKGPTSKGTMDDVYGSDSLAQLSTIMVGLLEDETVETELQRRVAILKGRNGETGDFLINWNFEGMDFSEVNEEEAKAELKFF